MTMSAIFLVHTIGFLLFLQPTLHLADDNEVSSRWASVSPVGGGERRFQSPPNNASNQTVIMQQMEMENTRFGIGMMTMTMAMTMTRRPGITHHGEPMMLDLPASRGASNSPVLARVYRHAIGVSPSLIPPSTSSAGDSSAPFPSPAQEHQNQNQNQHPPPHLNHHRQSLSSLTTEGRSEEEKYSNQNQNEQPLEPMYLPSSTRIFGPYFESNRTTITIVARAGQMVLLDCAVVLLQGRTVSWLRRKNDNLQLLTVGNATYSSDSRLGLHFRYPNNWRLGIVNVNKKDEGEYKCQLSTHPPKALIFHLKVIAPAVLILDENGNVITERHYKVDSSLHLTCKASHLDKLLDHIGWFKGDRSLPGGDSRIKVKLWKNSTNGEASAFLSVLSVRKGDSGNYTCRASPIASNTIAVHVLNGELPAAVQHENSANVLLGSDFLNSWPNTIIILILLISSTFAFPT